MYPHITSPGYPAHLRSQAEPTEVVKVLYDYDAAQPTELSVKEDEILHVYERDDDWILVASPTEEGRVGYVPGNYVEEVCAIDCISVSLSQPSTTLQATGEDEAAPPAAAAATSLSSIVVPDSVRSSPWCIPTISDERTYSPPSLLVP